MSDKIKLKQELLKLLNNNEGENETYLEEAKGFNESDDGHSYNAPIGTSPIYPHAIIGDSATPLNGQFHESTYKDDNYIGNTWKALINSYYS